MKYFCNSQKRIETMLKSRGFLYTEMSLSELAPDMSCIALSLRRAHTACIAAPRTDVLACTASYAVV